MHKHLSNQKKTCTQNTNTHNVRLMGSQAFNNTQRPARNPEIAQNPSTNVQTPNSVAPSAGVFNRFGNADDDDDSSVDSAVAQSVAVCFALNSRNQFLFFDCCKIESRIPMRILQVSAKSEQCNRSIELRIVNHCISFRFNFHFISFLKSLYTDDNNTTYNADNSCGSSTTYNTAGCHSIADQKIETSKQRK